MLQTLRDKTSGWIATFILGLLMVPFVFVIDGRYLGGDDPDDLAQIQAAPSWWPSAPSAWPFSMLWQRQTISVQAFKQRFDQLRMQSRDRLQDRFDARAFDRVDNQLRIVNQMIDERIMNATAVKAHLAVNPQKVYETIASLPAFQSNGVFDKAMYISVLARMNPPRTPKTFEQLVRESLVTSAIPDSLMASSFYPVDEVKHVLALMGEKRTIQWLPLAATPHSAVAVTPEKIAQWYASHLEAFRQPEQVTIEYVQLTPALLPKLPAPQENTLRQRYEAEKSRFFVAEERQVQHLLITAGADAEHDRIAKAEAARLAEQARRPDADFTALARRFSQDTGSKESGGQLGWISKGSMPKSFDDAVFALKPGEVSDPVRTTYGYHIIKVTDVRSGHGQSFDAVRSQLAEEYQREEAAKAFNTMVGHFVDSVEQGGQGFVAAAKQAGVAISQLGPFSRDSGPGIAGDARVRQIAFDLAESSEHSVSGPIALGPEQTVFLRPINHTQATQLTLDRVRQQVIMAIQKDAAERAERAVANQLLARLARGSTFAAIAQERGVHPVTFTAIRRGSHEPSAAANKAIFAVPSPRDKKPVFGLARLETGQYALFEVDSAMQDDLKTVSPDQLRLIADQLAQMEANRALEVYLAALRHDFKITINRTLLHE